MQNVDEIIEDKVPVEIENIQNKTKQQDNDIVANKKKEEVEEPKFSDSEQQGEDDKTYNFRSTSGRALIETQKRGTRQYKFRTGSGEEL